MNDAIGFVRDIVINLMHEVAAALNKVSRGRISPDAVTIFGVLMHVPIAFLIGSGHFLWAALLLVVFGLFDKLDGELARLQKRASVRGMLLDASTDRMKEVMLYSGAAYVLAGGTHPRVAAWAVAACGASLCVSYVKAKGEAAIASSKKQIPHATLNHMFQDGLLTFELRMAVLVLGLLTGKILLAVGVIAVLSSYTALQRLVVISRKLEG